MKDGDLYRMWWTRQSAPSSETRRYEGTDEEAESLSFDYPVEGDRVFFTESRDGYTTHATWNSARACTPGFYGTHTERSSAMRPT